MDCIFCKIKNKEMPSYIIYEDDLIMIILDAFPNSDGHSLVIPKTHYETIHDVDDDVLLHMFNYAKKYSNIIMDKLNLNSMSFLINYGESQIVKHLHLHIVSDIRGTNTSDIDEIFKKITS